MSKGPKVSIADRQAWLEAYESGARIDIVAKEAGRTERTVKDHIDKARQERAVAQAEREQLKEALGAHQQDLLSLIQRLRDAVYAPPLQLTPDIRPRCPEAFLGLENVISHPMNTGPRLPDEVAEILPETRSETGPIRAIRVETENADPVSLTLMEEDSLLWSSLKQHLGKADPMWRLLRDWKKTLLDGLIAQAATNREYGKLVEDLLDAQVSEGLQTGRLITPELVVFVRMEVTRRALGQQPIDVESSVRVTETHLDHRASGAVLAQGLSDKEGARSALEKLVESLWREKGSREVAGTHIRLRSQVEKVRKSLAEYLLIHHIRGRCRLCRKLSG